MLDRGNNSYIRSTRHLDLLNNILNIKRNLRINFLKDPFVTISEQFVSTLLNSKWPPVGNLVSRINITHALDIYV